MDPEIYFRLETLIGIEKPIVRIGPILVIIPKLTFVT